MLCPGCGLGMSPPPPPPPKKRKTITSLVKEVMFSVAFVCLSFCLLAKLLNISQKVLNGLRWNFMAGSGGGKRNKWLNFGDDSDHHADCPIRNPTITQQIMSRFWWNFQDSSAVIQETIYFFVGGWVFWITMLTLQIGNPGNMVVAVWGPWSRRSALSECSCYYIWINHIKLGLSVAWRLIWWLQV